MHTLTDEQHKHLLGLVRRMAITTRDTEWELALEYLECDRPVSNVTPLFTEGWDSALASRKAPAYPEDAPDVDPGTRGLVKAFRHGWELGRRNEAARSKEGA